MVFGGFAEGMAEPAATKEMERIFGVSYPTIKTRLKRIAEHLDDVIVDLDDPGSKMQVYCE